MDILFIIHHRTLSSIGLPVSGSNYESVVFANWKANVQHMVFHQQDQQKSLKFTATMKTHEIILFVDTSQRDQS